MSKVRAKESSVVKKSADGGLGEHYLPFASRIVRQIMSRFNVPPGHFV